MFLFILKLKTLCVMVLCGKTVYLCYAYWYLPSITLLLFDMATRNSNKSWSVLCWNIMGVNAESKWESLKNKVSESQCDVVCLQETKRENFDIAFIKLLCPPS